MPEETNSIDYVMEKASGPHFSGLRLDGLLSSPPSSATNSPAHRNSSASASASPLAPKQPFVIGVSGGTASGKTTVCDMIIQQLHDHRVVLVNQDSFYRGLTPAELERVHEYNFDHPDAFDTEQLLDCIEKLRSGHPYQVPIYDFKSHRRSSDCFRQVNASDVIILEGILVFHDQHVRNLMNMKIFVDTDADVRLARRIRRDTVERGRDINSVLEQYAKFVKPAFDDFVLPSKKYADVIIPRGGDNHVAIDLIVQHIRTKLGQHDLCKIYPNVYVIQSTFQIRGMHTLIRDKEISKHDFVFYSDRLIRLVVEHGLGHLPFTEKQVITPTGSVYTGVDFCKKLCGVSIVRSGESMENALRACCKGIKIGKILIHRDGDNGKQLIYEKLPKDIPERHVLLLDPVLATGNSANRTYGHLLVQAIHSNADCWLAGEKMHGRPRKASKPEDEEASAAKGEKLRALQSQLLSNHRHKIYTKEAVELSTKLLEINPECYTAWNYRKLAVEHNLTQSDSDPNSVKSILEEELRMVEIALRQNFKSYSAWHHRKWVLSKGHSSIEKELKLLEKFQSADPRNFHAWSYRRFVAALMNRSEEDELEYTQSLIDKNISNYSAWHNRSFLLSNLMKKNVEGFTKKDEVLIKEYELVREALFTDEDDQSGWFYHLWLLEQTVKAKCPVLVATWPVHGSDLILLRDRYLDASPSSPFSAFQFDSGTFPLILYFSQAVEGVNSSTVNVDFGSNLNQDLVWKPLSTINSHAAQVWITQLSLPNADLHSLEAYPVEISLGHCQGIISSSGIHYSQSSHFSFTVRVQPVKKESTEVSGVEKMSWTDENFYLCEPYSGESNLVAWFQQVGLGNEHELEANAWQAKIIEEEMEHFRLLSDCKIGKLTLARLLTAHDSLMSSGKLVHSEEILALYSDLMKSDPSHYWYYKDQHSMVLLQQVMSSREYLSHCFHYRDLTSSIRGYPICLRLNKLSLSRIGSVEKLLWVQMLDLSHNELQSIEGLDAMQLLTHLNLSKNKLSSFTALEPLRQLKSLKVLDISYNEIGAHSIDTTRYLCSSPLSHSVGNEWEGDKILIDGVSLTNYWEAFFVLKGLKLTQLDVVGNAIADENFTLFLVKVLPTLKWLDGVQLN